MVLSFDDSGAQELDTALSLPGAVSQTALTLPRGLPFDVWARTGERLRDLDKAWKWWFGDWLNYGEAEYPDEFSQMFDVVEMPYQTVMNIKSVAKRIPPSERRADLSWSHHEAVAKLGPTMRTDMLDAAQADGWSRSTLREEVKRLDGPTPPAACRCCCHAEQIYCNGCGQTR